MRNLTLLNQRPDPVRAVFAGLVLLCFHFTLPVAADSPAVPRPMIATSQSGEFFFKMVPAESHWDGEQTVTTREAFGVAYQIDAKGNFVEQWRTEGWYTFEAFISDNGRYLARMGPWASDPGEKTDLAVAFYDRGKLIRQYEVKDLLKDEEAIERSVSHYFWRPEKQSVETGFTGDGFHLTMIDKTTYLFDPATGTVISEGIDNEIETFCSAHFKEEQKRKTAAKELYRESAFREDYDQHFSLSNLDAHVYSTGIHFPGPQWHATMLPKKELPEYCSVSVVFPIDAVDGVETTFSGEEILSALVAGLDHPWIKEKFKGDPFSGASGLRFRITGDRLHRSTKELREQLKAVGLKADSLKELRDWGYFIIDGSDPRYTSLYLNVKTGDLVFEDPSSHPREIWHFDSTGKQVQAP